jgi:hypothetical protein
MIKTTTMKRNETAAAHGISILAIMYAMIILTMLIVMSSCGSTKYVDCDAYKTHYKPLKAEKHKHHIKCDAYN